MLTVDSIIKVAITRETSSKTVRDLQTIAVLSQHEVFAETHRVYTDSSDMLTDGFQTTDFAYIAVSKILSQNPQVKEVVVGKAVAEGTDPVDYVANILALQGSTNNWFFLITDATSKADKEAIAAYIETQTLFYLFSDSDPATPTSATTDIFSILSELKYTKSAGIYIRDNTVVAAEAAWAGRHASAVIGSNLWLYKTLVGLVAESFTSTEVSYLKQKNAQFYTKVGADSVVVGNATTVGGERIHVILGAIWLEVRIGERYWNLLYSKERILYTNAGIDMFKAELIGVLNEAVSNNILTADDGFNIITPDANKLTSQKRSTATLSGIKFRARLAGAIIYVDAVEGTIYE